MALESEWRVQRVNKISWLLSGGKMPYFPETPCQCQVWNFFHCLLFENVGTIVPPMSVTIKSHHCKKFRNDSQIQPADSDHCGRFPMENYSYVFCVVLVGGIKPGYRWCAITKMVSEVMLYSMDPSFFFFFAIHISVFWNWMWWARVSDWEQYICWLTASDWQI